MTYVTNEVKTARPPAPIRSQAVDWNALEEWEKLLVNLCLAGNEKLKNVSLRGREFLRRHHGRTA